MPPLSVQPYTSQYTTQSTSSVCLPSPTFLFNTSSPSCLLLPSPLSPTPSPPLPTLRHPRHNSTQFTPTSLTSSFPSSALSLPPPPPPPPPPSPSVHNNTTKFTLNSSLPCHALPSPPPPLFPTPPSSVILSSEIPDTRGQRGPARAFVLTPASSRGHQCSSFHRVQPLK